MNNPDAFPSPGVVLPGGSQQGAYPGMSLRDYFAAAALPEVMRAGVGVHPLAVALACYRIADAMLTARTKANEVRP